LSKINMVAAVILYHIIFLYPEPVLLPYLMVVLKFKFNFLALVVSEILWVPNLHYGALCPWMPLSGKIFVPAASTLPHLIVFLISLILALVVSEIIRGPKFT